MTSKNSGERLNYIFNSLGLTIKEVAKRLKVSNALFEQTIRNRFRLRKVTALALQAEFNINHEWLLYGKGPELIHSELDEEDTRLVSLFINLNDKDRRNIIGILESINRRSKK